jgi:hypothetical protein
MTVRIAMWSGPRNISTAMMRSFGARADTFVSDEPFYGAFLKQSGAPHPMAAEVIADMDCDWSNVAATLSGDPPQGQAIWYQKHMTHHMVGPVQPDDLAGVTHAFLIRDPGRMIASYLAKRELVAADELGLRTQRAFFDREADRLGHAPPVIDSGDVLSDPAGTLSRLCTALGIAWDPAMLRWAPGPRATDGIWASHWYNRVTASTGFDAPEEKPVDLPSEALPILGECQPHYDYLRQFTL